MSKNTNTTHKKAQETEAELKRKKQFDEASSLDAEGAFDEAIRFSNIKRPSPDLEVLKVYSIHLIKPKIKLQVMRSSHVA